MEKEDIMGLIITDESALSVVEVHYSIEDWQMTKENAENINNKNGRISNSQNCQSVRMKSVEAEYKIEFDALQKQKCQIDEQISDLRAGRNGTQTTIIIEAPRSEETENHEDIFAVHQEQPEMEGDDVDTKDLNMAERNDNEIMLPTHMLKDVSKKEKKEIKKLVKTKKKNEKKLQKVLDKKARLYYQMEEDKKKAEEKEMWKSWHNDVMKEIKDAKKEKERSRKELKKEKKGTEKQEKKCKKNQYNNKDVKDNGSSKNVTENKSSKVVTENKPSKDATENLPSKVVIENEPSKNVTENEPTKTVTENETTKDEMPRKKVEALFYVGGYTNVVVEHVDIKQKKKLVDRIRGLFSCFPCIKKVKSS